MKVAMKKIKAEFGDDALILNQKRIKKNRKHPDWKDEFEITAAVDKKDKKSKSSKTFKKQFKSAYSSQKTSTKVSSKQYDLLQDELDYLSERLDLLVNHIKYENLPHIPKSLQKKVKTLIKHGVKQSFSNSIIEKLLISMKGEDFLNDDKIDDKIILKIKNKLSVAGPIKFNKNQPTIVSIVGPTGAGKSTLVAKLAALYKYTYKKRIALISLDSYRIAAMEQLKAFAGIAKIPFMGIYKKEDILKKINNLKDNDLILIDTAGINPGNMKKMVALKEMLRIAKVDNIYLSLSLTSKESYLKTIIKQFMMIPFDSIIYTKLDEVEEYGDILNISLDYEQPIAYLSTGQNIPEDIRLADRKEISTLILRGENGIL